MPERELGVSDFGISPGGGVVGPGAPRHPVEDARFELAGHMRRITSAIVGLPIVDAEIAVAAAALKEVADGLERGAAPGRRLRAQPDPVGDPQEFFPTSP